MVNLKAAQNVTSPYITLILPAFNESSTIADTVSKTAAYFELRGYSWQIIVAADGNDGTREIVAKLRQNNSAVHVIGHPERLGKGRAVREAIELATGSIIGYADADYKVPIEEFDKIVPLLKDYDVVIGSRAVERSLVERPQPWYRRVGSRGFAVFMHTVVGLPEIGDTQCGFKFFHRAAAQELFRCQKIDRYMFDVEILSLATLFGYRIKEVAVRWRDDGDSRLDLVTGNIRNVVDIFRIRAWRGQYLRELAKSRARTESQS
jgi:glycosyltransferase involved in cell wall biosynthesis